MGPVTFVLIVVSGLSAFSTVIFIAAVRRASWMRRFEEEEPGVEEDKAGTLTGEQHGCRDLSPVIAIKLDSRPFGKLLRRRGAKAPPEP